MLRVRSRGANLAVDVDGEPPVDIVLCHGGPGAPSDFGFVRELLSKRGIPCARFDQRGVHRSTCEDGRWGLAAHAEDLEAIREEVGAPTIVALGHSFGGLVARAWAKRFPDRVRGLLLSSPATVLGSEFRDAQQHVKAVVMRGLDRRQLLRLVVANLVAKLPGRLGDRGVSEVYRLVLEAYTGAPAPPWVAHCSARATRLTRRAIEREDPRALDDLGLDPSVPIHVAFGDRDIHGPRARAFAARFPNTSFFEDCGHVLWHDQPRAFERWLHRGLAACGLVERGEC